ncbi:MAG: LysM peptidoglycan-binding domain-containing protein [Candidatus Cloacimonetes bacterium]|jgi:murein DD-endopeptidase MepM/ murein hydrolase activator NlpD|nr:LysM peptidoglycan-binding domain-containing protein [Candidatus Cloacimonadota bacterium]MDY0336887.1 LysM peptidoglycan-binding domain-containing protein [Candidatus Cloacimonadaceae bacterium]MCK9334846.1 LysM peptidoglycan-binding domain-containing protein [Candidatus Cloacimonadota bacterium]MDD2543426.1 LysM peptidoglycan-binding domain-containing protein [Candidatus Cloacimonadota bacterium]MDD2683602.1 LysM peptidoglycan-binding domain-containing protein [Candidatus Cloacimonadota ba
MILKLDRMRSLVLLLALVLPLIAFAQDVTHTVKRGDTLYALSRRYGVSVQQIQTLNNLSGSSLSIGQKLLIKKSPPASETAISAPAQIPQISPSSDAYYTIKRGDNLFRIAQSHQISLPDLLTWNNFESAEVQIFPGQKILVKNPETIESSTGSETTAEDANRLSISTAADPDTVVIEKVYIVQPKDTLFKIARENNISVEELRRINNLSSSDIKVGQKLYLAGSPKPPGSQALRPSITEEELMKMDKIRSDLVSPVEGRVLSEYGLRNGRPHKGIDIGAKTGTPIHAVLDGTVVYSGVQGAYGNVVVIEHPDFVMTVYAHNEKNLVSVGDKVTKGQHIANAGATGNASGSHLHFEYRIKGKAINPRKVLPLE